MIKRELGVFGIGIFKRVEMPAYNERFGASGGVVSADTEQVH
jgi:hypothetical protein